MERLTYWNCKEKGSALPVSIDDDGDVVDLETLCAKLASYEDIGLTPEEVEELKAIKWWSQCGADDMMPTVFGAPINRLRELAAADRDGRVVVLPFTVGDTVDRLFSHNEVIALWYDKPDDKDYSYLLWRGMAWEIPEEYRNLAFLRIKGIVPETIDKADTINIQVPPYVIPCAEAKAAMKEQEAADAY